MEETPWELKGPTEDATTPVTANPKLPTIISAAFVFGLFVWGFMPW